MTDVPLADANILWTGPNGYARDPALAGRVSVEHRKQEPSLYNFHRTKLGACIMWRSWSPEARLIELFRYVHLMTVRDGIDPKVVHQGLLTIPEYRGALANEAD